MVHSKKHHFVLALIALFLGLIMTAGCTKELSGAEFVLGTICKIRIWGHDESELEAAFDRIREIENRMSRHKSGSQIKRIGQDPGQGVQLSPDTCLVVKRALEFGRLTGGMFDISIAPVVELWGFGGDRAGLPSAGGLKAALPLVDYRKIKLRSDCRLQAGPGQAIDLGGIAKGYASDEAARILKEAGVERALINLGGNVLAFGQKPGGEPWRLGIQDPLKGPGQVVGVLEESQGAVVTAGIYQRFVEYQGKRYHHILDPRTGYPVDNDLAGVSVTAPSGLEADALSTSLFLLGVERGCKLLDSFPQCGAVFVTKDREIITAGTASAKFKLTNKEYQVTRRR